MNPKHQKESKTINLIRIDGTGSMRLQDRSIRDCNVVGYFSLYGKMFFVNRDSVYPDYYLVSEASTGTCITEYCYEDIETAVKSALTFLEDKRYYLHTSIGKIVVKENCDLQKRNSTNLQTIGIDTLLYGTQ